MQGPGKGSEMLCSSKGISELTFPRKARQGEEQNSTRKEPTGRPGFTVLP